MRAFIIACILFSGLLLYGQRKMPAITFLDSSIEFADGNKSFSEVGQLTDTLRDEHIIKALVKILTYNPKLHIELAGHCAGNEDSTFAQLRADRVRDLLVAEGVDSSRISPKSYGFQQPVINNEVLLSLSSRAERDEANQRNRRVEIEVVAVKPD